MSEINYHYAAFLPPDNKKCPVCGVEPMKHVRNCSKMAEFVCEKHCQHCSDWDSSLSIGFCRFNKQAEGLAEAEGEIKSGKGMELRGIRMVFGKNKKYVIFRPWEEGEGRYDVFNEEETHEAWGFFWAAVDKSGRWEIKQAKRENRIPEIAAELRGVKLWRSDGGMWYVEREDQPEHVEALTDALEAWVYFTESVDTVVRKSIQNKAKNS